MSFKRTKEIPPGSGNYYAYRVYSENEDGTQDYLGPASEVTGVTDPSETGMKLEGADTEKNTEAVKELTRQGTMIDKEAGKILTMDDVKVIKSLEKPPMYLNKNMLRGLRKGKHYLKEAEKVNLRAKSDIPSFMGVDMEGYPATEEGETLEIPEDNAEILINRGSAGEIEDQKQDQEYQRRFQEVAQEKLEGGKKNVSGVDTANIDSLEGFVLMKRSDDGVLTQYEDEKGLSEPREQLQQALEDGRISISTEEKKWAILNSLDKTQYYVKIPSWLSKKKLAGPGNKPSEFIASIEKETDDAIKFSKAIPVMKAADRSESLKRYEKDSELEELKEDMLHRNIKDSMYDEWLPKSQIEIWKN